MTGLGPLVDLLHRAGLDVDAEVLLDAFWLAHHTGPLSLGRLGVPVVRPPVPGPPTEPVQVPDTTAKPGPRAAQPKQPVSTTPPETAALVARADTGGPSTGRASPVSIPAGRALPNRLPLARALRPLLRRFPAANQPELDETATAEATADLGGRMYPVFRPRLEPWFDVDVVLESEIAAGAFLPLLRDFSQMLRETGAFRVVRLSRLRLDAKPVVLESVAGARRGARELEGGARRLVFFASHGSAVSWLDGGYPRILHNWSRSASVVLLHLLPRQQWKRTPLGDPQGLARTLVPGAASAHLDTSQFWWTATFDAEGVPLPPRLKLPAVALDAAEFATWSHMLMARGRQSPVFLFPAPALDPTDPVPAPRELEPEAAVAFFREAASPEAFLLAVLLCSTPFTLPVARLTQEAQFGGAASPSQLAEVLLSGLVRAQNTARGDRDPDSVRYEFPPEIRSVLLRSLRQADADTLRAELESRVSAYIERIYKRQLRFSALIPDAAGEFNLPDWAQPFARLHRTLLARAPEEKPAPVWPPGQLKVYVSARAGHEAFLLDNQSEMASHGLAVYAGHQTGDLDMLETCDVVLVLGPDEGLSPWQEQEIEEANIRCLRVVRWPLNRPVLPMIAMLLDHQGSPAILHDVPVAAGWPKHKHADLDRFTKFFFEGESFVVVYSSEVLDAADLVAHFCRECRVRSSYRQGIYWGIDGPPALTELRVYPGLLDNPEFDQLRNCIWIDPGFETFLERDHPRVFEADPLSVDEAMNRLLSALPQRDSEDERIVLYLYPFHEGSRRLVNLLALLIGAMGVHRFRALTGSEREPIYRRERRLLETALAGLPPEGTDTLGFLYCSNYELPRHVLSDLCDEFRTDWAGLLLRVGLLREQASGIPRLSWLAINFLGRWDESVRRTWHESILNWYRRHAPEGNLLRVEDDGYIHNHLFAHLKGAGLDDAAQRLASDPEWWRMRYRQDGPEAFRADMRRLSEFAFGRSIFAEPVPDRFDRMGLPGGQLLAWVKEHTVASDPIASAIMAALQEPVETAPAVCWLDMPFEGLPDMTAPVERAGYRFVSTPEQASAWILGGPDASLWLAPSRDLNKPLYSLPLLTQGSRTDVSFSEILPLHLNSFFRYNTPIPTWREHEDRLREFLEKSEPGQPLPPNLLDTYERFSHFRLWSELGIAAHPESDIEQAGFLIRFLIRPPFHLVARLYSTAQAAFTSQWPTLSYLALHCALEVLKSPALRMQLNSPFNLSDRVQRSWEPLLREFHSRNGLLLPARRYDEIPATMDKGETRAAEEAAVIRQMQGTQALSPALQAELIRALLDDPSQGHRLYAYLQLAQFPQAELIAQLLAICVAGRDDSRAQYHALNALRTCVARSGQPLSSSDTASLRRLRSSLPADSDRAAVIDSMLPTSGSNAVPAKKAAKKEPPRKKK